MSRCPHPLVDGFLVVILIVIIGFATFFIGYTVANSSRTGVLPEQSFLRFSSPGNSFQPAPELPGVVNRAFTRPLLPDWYGADAAHLRTIPLRVIKADADSGLACVETPDGGVVLLRIRGVVALNRGAYFHIVRMKGAGSEEIYDMAEEIPESAIDFNTGKFAEGTTYRRQADEMENIGP